MRASGQRLTFREAAELIYGTKHPTEVQVEKIAHRLARGVLEGSRRGEWVTADSVAAYIAAKAEQQRLAGKRPTSAGRVIGTEARKKLPPIYRHGFQDYVAAVLRRRQPEHTSAGFRRAVLIGQVGLILFPALALATIYATAFAPPAEQVAVERWLEQEVGEYQIVQWFPSERESGAVQRVRLKYKYFTPSRKQILTDRVFKVKNGEVIVASQVAD